MTVKNLGWSFIFRMFFCHKTRLLFQYWQLELCVPVHTCTHFDCLQFQGGYPTFPDKVFMWFVMELSPFPRIKGFNFYPFLWYKLETCNNISRLPLWFAFFYTGLWINAIRRLKCCKDVTNNPLEACLIPVSYVWANCLPL